MVTGGHKISTINEPIGRVPYEFLWAYLSGVFLPDVVQGLKPYFEYEYPELLGELGDYLLSFDNLLLYRPEQFYLIALLCYASPVENIAFEPK